MPYDGNGNYVRVHNWAADAANALDINATEMDAEDNSIAAALSNAVTRDGQGKMGVDFLPSADNTLNLGTGALRWATINGLPINSIVSGIYYKQTLAEAALSITPTVFTYVPGHVLRYHATGTLGVSAANDTAAVLAVFKVCIQGAKTGGASSCPGYIPAGTYLIQEGVLAFDTPFVDAAFPNIYTAGENCVIFKGAAFADAAMITLTNGTANSTAGKYWRGGYLGPIWFQTNRVSGSNGHGLSLRGCQDISFGHMRGDNLFGSVIYCPSFKYLSTNPDPYAVQESYFDGIESNNSFFALDNENDIGFNVNQIRLIVANGNTQGVVKNGGEMNVFVFISCGNCLGWAYDEGQDGTQNNADRNVILGAEIDTCQNGIRINKCWADRFTGIRFIHRYNFGQNSSNLYWPLTSIDIAGGTSPNIEQLRIECMHRIEVGAGSPAKSTLGKFVDFHSESGGTLSSVEIYQEFLDQGTGYTYVDTDWYSNVGTFPNALAAVFLAGRRIYDSRIASITLVCGTIATSILHTGFNTAANIVQFPTAVSDRNSCFNTGTGVWTAPYSGLARVTANVALTMAANNSARMAIMELTSGGTYNTTLLYSEAWSVTASVQHYKLSGLMKVQQGFQYCLSMDQSTAGNITPSLPSGAFVPDLYLHIEMCNTP